MNNELSKTNPILSQFYPNQTQFYLAIAPVLRSFSGGGLAKADKLEADLSPREFIPNGRRSLWVCFLESSNQGPILPATPFGGLTRLRRNPLDGKCVFVMSYLLGSGLSEQYRNDIEPERAVLNFVSCKKIPGGP